MWILEMHNSVHFMLVQPRVAHSQRVVVVHSCCTRRWWRRRCGGHSQYSTCLLRVARLDVRVHVRTRTEARGDQDAATLTLAVHQCACVLCRYA